MFQIIKSERQQQIEEIIAYKTQGAILRSKVKWYNEVEKNQP